MWENAFLISPRKILEVGLFAKEVKKSPEEGSTEI